MKRVILVTIAAFVALPAAAGDPQPPTAVWYGNNLTRFCEAGEKSVEYAMCWSFISAVLEVARNNPIYGLKICAPPTISAQKAVDLTIKWLREHPDRDIQAASSVTAEALAAAFPCETSN